MKLLSWVRKYLRNWNREKKNKMVKSKSEQEIINKIMQLKPGIIKSIQKAILNSVKDNFLNNYKIAWDQLQEIATPEIKKILQDSFKGCTIEITKSKSTYPDLKMSFLGFDFAFDIKSNESSKEPWYDIARLDTIKKERLDKYSEEFDVVIKYDSDTGELLDIYFEIMRHTVGWNSKCKGVKFRPYDGKLRPKSWDDFRNGNIRWKTEDDFLKGIRNSQVYRWKILISEILVKLLTKEEKEDFKKLFD